METLVDDFVTFYVAGEIIIWDRPHLHVDHVIQPLGQETTANTLSFVTILIHQHPDVLDRCVFMCVCGVCMYVYVCVYVCMDW